jgi:hypothetical protein
MCLCGERKKAPHLPAGRQVAERLSVFDLIMDYFDLCSLCFALESHFSTIVFENSAIGSLNSAIVFQNSAIGSLNSAIVFQNSAIEIHFFTIVFKNSTIEINYFR